MSIGEGCHSEERASATRNLDWGVGMRDLAETIIRSRDDLPVRRPTADIRSQEAEGGCGVIGLASSRPIKGKYLITPCAQMCNRGNGKGGGVAVAGCFPHYADHFAVQVGYLDLNARRDIEQKYLFPVFDIAQIEEQPFVEDYREFPRLDIEPPRVVRYFSRVKADVLDRFASEHGFTDQRAAEEEFVFQNSFRLNKEFYGDREDKQGFVLSHGRNMMILKAVGYAEDIAEYYRLHDMEANVWIGHQRYPTRGRVWHPGGAHPFSGLDEALVHNGDFANYFGVTEYLRQRNYFPLFMTDTEVSVYLFDLYSRVYGYPLEYVIEALAPTTERDFTKLPPDKQRIYRAIQRSHLHASPDGPWFFIVARNDVRAGALQLIGITDTSMLRPQVFALQSGERALGVIASEKQAIDALLYDIARDDPAVAPVADKYWNARGGSYSDGGAFIYAVKDGALTCTDKFGREVRVGKDEGGGSKAETVGPPRTIEVLRRTQDALRFIGDASLSEIDAFFAQLIDLARRDAAQRRAVIDLLTTLHDRRYDTGAHPRSRIVAGIDRALETIFRSVTPIDGDHAASGDRLIGFVNRSALRPATGGHTLFIDCAGFEPQGEESAARLIVRAYEAGWRKFVVFACRGDRFIGCGLGAKSDGVRIDVYGSSGDYLGSGLDGAEIQVHGDAQDQVGQIMKSGKLVIHGMVGQTFLYGAKGGVAYVLGNAAGRPLINAVGKIRAVINGTALDYAAESFMAGATTGGGFVIINGVTLEGDRIVALPDRYPGGNFFSLASGGAGYVLDPDGTLGDDQLNGGEIVALADDDWRVIEPYLRENEALFGLRVSDLLNGRAPHVCYRKVIPANAVKKIDGHT